MNKQLLIELMEDCFVSIVPELQTAFERERYDKNDLLQTLIDNASSKPKRVSLAFQMRFLKFAWPLTDEDYKKSAARRLCMSLEASEDLMNYLEGKTNEL